MTDQQLFISQILNQKSYLEVEKLFRLNIESLIQLIIHKSLGYQSFSIGLASLGKELWSTLCFDEYDDDTRFSLRYSSQGFDLTLNYYNDEQQDFVEFTHILSTHELSLIPQGLLPILKRSWEEKKPCTIEPSILERS